MEKRTRKEWLEHLKKKNPALVKLIQFTGVKEDQIEVRPTGSRKKKTTI